MVLIQIGGLGYMTIGAFLLLMVRGQIDMGGRHGLGDPWGAPVRESSSCSWRGCSGLRCSSRRPASLSFRRVSRRRSPIRARSIRSSTASPPSTTPASTSKAGMRGHRLVSSKTHSCWVRFRRCSSSAASACRWSTVLLTRLPWVQWTLDSKMAIVSSLALVALGRGWPSDRSRRRPRSPRAAEALGGRGAQTRSFISASARTALALRRLTSGGLTVQTLLLIMALMFVGGVSGSTAGGIKINTFATLFATAVSYLRGYKRVHAFGKVLPGDAGTPRHRHRLPRRRDRLPLHPHHVGRWSRSTSSQSPSRRSRPSARRGSQRESRPTSRRGVRSC